MRVLRKGGQFAAGRLNFCVWTSVAFLILAGAVVAGSRSFNQATAAFFAAGALLIIFQASVRRFALWFSRGKSESRVAEILRSLPDDYVVLSDIVLPGSKGNIDHVLIGPNGIYTIETKSYPGFVKCEDDQWFVNGRPIRSLSKQAKRNSMAVRGCIAKLFKGPKNRTPDVVPLLVFAGAHTRLKLDKPTVTVLRVVDLVKFIRDRASNRAIAEDEMRGMVNELQLLQRNFAETSEWPAMIEEDRRKTG